MEPTLRPTLRARTMAAWTGCETLLARPGAGWVLLVLLALVYTRVYSHHPHNPGTVSPDQQYGWWAWADQYSYWKSAQELAAGRLTAEGYHYPLGYPLLGALAWLVMPAHAFFIPDLLLVLGAAAAWWRLARGWLDRRLTLLAALAFLSLHGDILVLTQIVPWNTIATQAALLAGVAVLCNSPGPRAVLWLTILSMLTYWVRPGDAACFAPMLVWSVLRLPHLRQRLVCGLGGVAGIAAVVAAVALVNLAVFGTRSTPYERMSWDAVGFFAYPFWHKIYWLFVDGGTFFGETGTALLFRYPWLFLALPGVVWWVNRQGVSALAALATLGLNWVLYVNYNDFQPSAVFRFSLIHYLTWAFPLLFALTVAVVWHGWRLRSVRVALGLAGGLAIAATGVRLEPRVLEMPVAPGRVVGLASTRPLWVIFPDLPRNAEKMVRLDGQRPSAKECQAAYATADLRVILSAAARGTELAVASDFPGLATPITGDFVWGWRWSPARWRAGVGTSLETSTPHVER